MTDYSMTQEEWDAFSESAKAPTGRGPEFCLASNVDPDTDGVRVRRTGPSAGGLKARAAVFVETLIESEDDDVEDEIVSAVAYISAPEARQLAAALLNIADDIDGATPLTFFPRTPGGEEAPEAEEPSAATVAGTALVDFAAVTGDTGDTGHGFRVGERVQVVSLYIAADGLPCAYCRSLARPSLFQIVAQADLDTVSFLSDEESGR